MGRRWRVEGGSKKTVCPGKLIEAAAISGGGGGGGEC